jgi:CCR4-NOT transcription complex subunit 3
MTEPPTPSKVPAKETVKNRRESDDVKVEEKTPAKKGSGLSGLPTTTPRKVSNSEPSIKDVKPIPPVNFAQAKAAPITSPASASQTTTPAKAPAPASLPPIRYAAAAAAAVSPSQAISNATNNAASAPSPVATTETLPAESVASPPPPTSSSRGDANGTSSFSPALSHAQSTSMQSNSVASTPAIEHAKAVQQPDEAFPQSGGQVVSPAQIGSTSIASALPSNGATSSPNRSHEASSLRQGSVNVSQNSPSVPSAIAAPGPSATDGGVNAGAASGNVDGTASFQPAQLAASSAAAGVVQPAGGGAGTSSQQAAAQKQQGTEARLPSSLADLVSSFESAKQNSMRRDNDLGQVHASLESSFMNVPEPQDSDRPKYYVPQNPYPTPHWYPQTPASIFDNPAIYTKLDDDTLFYIFYYSQRDYHRYLAARELKRQSWRFSIRYGTWFRRHSEPIVINEEYEEGS